MSEIREFTDLFSGKIVTDRNRFLAAGEDVVEGQVLSLRTATGQLYKYDSRDGAGYEFYGIARSAASAGEFPDVVVNAELCNGRKVVFDYASDTMETTQETAREHGINFVRFAKRQLLTGEDSE